MSKAAITGIHGYVPDYVLTNTELERMVDTNDEWITSRTGIRERHILKGEGMGSSHMGAKAVQGLLEKTNTAPEDIDLLICATTTPDYVFPCTANLICDMVGIRNIGSFDIQAACSGFVYALTIGSQFIETGKYKKIVVVGADKMSAIVDYTDRATCVLFGDGAGAVLLEPNEEGLGIIDSIIRSDGVGQNHLFQKAGGSRYPPTHETVEKRWHYVYQDGPSVFKFAVKNMADVSAEIMERNNLTGSDVAWLVPHQANKRIIDATAQRMGIEPERVMMTIHKYGNTTAATIPLCLAEYESQLKKGDNLVLAAFGGGFTWGAAYVKWAYSSEL
ncbi:3-oxoacyl-[acyl-carrier-protein] synthase III [Spirosoma oryzae]|jgi:3-oxoacyl-[acyl-carrier-protein] synthase-3|uniref:Beta-ketoacyl-[acyl-carrier-protein] synthase III n=1 Tax=Spirosoma oryzae TaxID=1469603 RepID=A0A2T0TIE9_9BACT|nr:beta-ketoacyl-ACP synthase III [Spirosoma oryzae]PRY45348.1 3-oxoacyl-[acyl-carrier-protein] synthase III [Spirosoma oryzae]